MMNILKSSSNKINHKTLIKNPQIFTRQMSKALIPKKQLRVRDNAYDNHMEIQKKVRRVLKFQDMILTQSPQIIPMARLVFLANRAGFKKSEAVSFVLKYPLIFEVYEHPVQRILYLRLTREAIIQINEEKKAVDAQIDDCVIRLRKLLMLSNTHRLYLEHVRVSRREFGFPDDFEYSVVLKHPEYFRMFDGIPDENGEIRPLTKYIELVEPKNDNVNGREKYRKLDVCAIERVREIEYRRRGVNEENVRFGFLLNFPPRFELKKRYKIGIWKWQRLPYWSPYEDISGHDMRSSEAQNRWEKRAVAMIHEILSLSVEKKMPLQRIALFRITMDLPKKPLEFILQHQGIFYVSTRGNNGKLHMVFLKEAYKMGELVEPNEVYYARKQLDKLIMACRKITKHEDEFVSYSRREYGVGSNGSVSGGGNAVVKQDTDLQKIGYVGSDCSDGDEDHLSTDADETVKKDSDLEIDSDSDSDSDCSDGDDDLSLEEAKEV